MIINTGSRTDIPAFYSDWFINRIHEGFVMVRNPYYPDEVIRYTLDPKVVDLLSFCTKNPGPMLRYLDELDAYRQFWYVTITPYGKDIEPNVPDKMGIIDSVIALSKKFDFSSVGWRYDPVFISDKYSIDYHLRAFDRIATALKGYVGIVTVSFIDLYKKTKRNFPEVREVSWENQVKLIREFVRISRKNGMELHTCLENEKLAAYGANVSGCFSQQVVEKAIGDRLKVPKLAPARAGCSCLLGADIGEYNTCSHFCRYCYANYNRQIVLENRTKHDPDSPLLIGNLKETDRVREAVQASWLDLQLTLF